MFVEIKCESAHTILIAVPHDGAEKSLPALAAMLEQNAIFLKSPRYRELEIAEPKMTIHLGNSFVSEQYDSSILVKLSESSAIIDDCWRTATPETFVSNRKAIEKLEEQVRRLTEDKASLKTQLDRTMEELELVRRNDIPPVLAF